MRVDPAARVAFASGGGKVNWVFAIVYFAILTMGELYFSPVGLSLYAKAAPPQIAGLMMAVFLATSSPGNFLAGWFGTFYSTMTNTEFFLFIAAIAAAPAPVIWLFDKPLKKIMDHHESQRLKMEDVPYQTPIQ